MHGSFSALLQAKYLAMYFLLGSHLHLLHGLYTSAWWAIIYTYTYIYIYTYIHIYIYTYIHIYIYIYIFFFPIRMQSSRHFYPSHLAVDFEMSWVFL